MNPKEMNQFNISCFIGTSNASNKIFSGLNVTYYFEIPCLAFTQSKLLPPPKFVTYTYKFSALNKQPHFEGHLIISTLYHTN